MPQVPETFYIAQRVGVELRLNEYGTGFTASPRDKVQPWLVAHLKRNKPELVAYLKQEYTREHTGNGVTPDEHATCTKCGATADYRDTDGITLCLECLWPPVDADCAARTVRNLDPTPERIGGDTSIAAPVELKPTKRHYLPNPPKKPLPKPKMDGTRPVFGGFSK